MNKEKKNASAAGDKETESQEPPLEYTKEQMSHVHRILVLSNNKACLYEILDVPKDASEAEIHKALKEWARKVHPDKNPAPGATEAMKAVNYAAAVLLVADKRLEYDRQRAQPARRDRTPEEVFNSFFSPESLASLREMMPWLALSAGVFLVGAGAYKFLSSSKKEPELAAENGAQRKRMRK